MNFNGENMPIDMQDWDDYMSMYDDSHVPMCKVCGEYEVSAFQAHFDFCSDICADMAYEYDTDGEPTDMQDWDDYMSMYDDGSNPYTGTYSED